jgi:hypothetical protein
MQEIKCFQQDIVGHRFHFQNHRSLVKRAQNKKIVMDTTFLNGKQQECCQKVKTLFETEIAQLKQTAENLFKHKNAIYTASREAQVSSI